MSQIVTYTGRVVDPLNLDPGKVNIMDIAHSLSNQCRFTGHVREFYSVAQHSFLCVTLGMRLGYDTPRLKTLLLHDGSEAYLSDLARPVKQAPGLGDTYRLVEDSIQEVVAHVFDLDYPFPGYVHRVDNALLAAEQRDLMPRHRHLKSRLVYKPTITGWPPEQAKDAFLGMYEGLTGDAPKR